MVIISGFACALVLLEGKKKALHQGEGSSSAVKELKKFEKGSKDISPHQP